MAVLDRSAAPAKPSMTAKRATAALIATPGSTAANGKIRKATVDTSVPAVVLCPGYHGHGVARSLGRLGVRVYGVHKDPASPAARSRFWRHNYVWDFSQPTVQQSIDWLLQLARRIG